MKYMRTGVRTTPFLCLAWLCISVPVRAQKSSFVIEQAVEVPGTVLQPGAYMIRSMGPAPAGSPAGANRLEIVSSDESHVYATITSIPELRPPLPDNAMFNFYRSADGGGRAIKAWWPTPDPYPRQEQFVYPTEQALHLMAVTNESVLYLRPELLKAGGSSDAASLTTPPIAQVAPAAPAAAMPKTASDLPLLALAGVVFCGAGLCLRGLSLSMERAQRLASSVTQTRTPARGAVTCLLSGVPTRIRIVYRTS